MIVIRKYCSRSSNNNNYNNNECSKFYKQTKLSFTHWLVMMMKYLVLSQC